MEYITEIFFAFVAFMQNLTPAGLFIVFAMFIAFSYLLDRLFGADDATGGVR